MEGLPHISNRCATQLKISIIYMYILDDESNKKLNCITIILTKSEIQQMLGYAKQLLENFPSSDHYHLSSEDYQKEITICMYDPKNIGNFNPRIQKLIREDE